MACSALREATFLAVVFACSSIGVAATGIPSYAGPFIAYAEKFYMCGVNGSVSEWRGIFRHTHFNPQRPYDKQRLTGHVNYTRDFDDRWWGYVEISIQSNNQWKENGFLFHFPQGYVEISIRSNNQWKENAFLFRFPNRACTALRSNIPDFFRAVYYKKLGEVAHGKGKCRVPKDTYSFENEPVEWVFPNVPIIPYGHYRFSIISGEPGDARPMICLRIECHAIPRPPRPQ